MTSLVGRDLIEISLNERKNNLVPRFSRSDKKLKKKDPSLRINFVLETGDQTQPGSLSLSLSRSLGTGRREPWERG